MSSSRATARGTRRPSSAEVDAALVVLARSLGEPIPTDLDSAHLAMAVVAERAALAAEQVAREKVATARRQDEVTWQEIGNAIGLTRQAACERFNRTPRRRPTG